MKFFKLIILTACSLLMTSNAYAQDQYVHLLTKAEAAATGVQIGCTCYRNVQWKQASPTMDGLPLSERGKAQPVVKPSQTEVYDLYESVFGITVLKERHTIVVIDLSIQIKESNLTNVMAKRQLTFIGEMLNSGGASLYNIIVGNVNTPTGIIKEWVLNSKTPVPPYAVTKTEEYKVMSNALRVEQQILTKNDNSNSNQVDTWSFTYSVTLKGRNCLESYQRKIISQSIYVNVYKLLITKFKDKASQKDWKVVVGQDIEMDVNRSPDCRNFSWTMPDLLTGSSDNVWHLQRSNTNYLKIPFDDLSSWTGSVRVTNSDFGDKNGTVKVSCQDGSGNLHTIYTRNAPAGELSMNPLKAAKVYFPKDVDVKGKSTIPLMTNSEPLWFIFWKEGNVVEGLRGVQYDPTADFGYTLPRPFITSQVYVGAIAAKQNDGSFSTINPITMLSFNYTGNGKHQQCLIETIIHENYHKTIFDTNGWFPSFFNRHSDSDDIPDAEEEKPGTYSWPGSSLFLVARSDKTKDKTFNTPAGDDDQEIRGRLIELHTQGRLEAVYHKDKDWSATTDNQNWEN
jgi:hypothetical protein